MTEAQRCLIVGRGRAGGAFQLALTEIGWTTSLVPGRSILSDVPSTPAVDWAGADLILLAVPDHAVADVARVIQGERGVVAHVSGSLGLDALGTHGRVGSLHPLMSLPDAEIGAARLLDRCVFAVAGDELINDVVVALGGRPVTVDDDRRPLYHGVASIAANHLTALCAQVERLATDVGVPVDAYWTMMEATLQSVRSIGSAAALTGPASRGDWGTVRAHVLALPSDRERDLYLALAREAAAIAGQDWPADLG